jgi:beta-lactam-binding protein with PASTA domain
MGVVAVIVVVLIVLAWFVWPAKAATNARQAQRDRPDVDEAELEAAERDVQEAADEESVRDWGPGTGQKPLP